MHREKHTSRVGQSRHRRCLLRSASATVIGVSCSSACGGLSRWLSWRRCGQGVGLPEKRDPGCGVDLGDLFPGDRLGGKVPCEQPATVHYEPDPCSWRCLSAPGSGHPWPSAIERLLGYMTTG